MMEYGPSTSRYNRDRDRDRDKQHSNSTTISTSSLPTQPRSTLVSRNRLPPSISTISTSTPSSSHYSPPPRTSSLLPLPPTGPAAYRSRTAQSQSQSQPNTPSSSSKLTELNGPSQHAPLSMRLPNKPSMMSGSGNVRRVNHNRRSRSPSNSTSTVLTTPLPIDRERPNSSRSSSIVLSTGGGGEKDKEERAREEARRLERAERFGTGLASTSTSTSTSTSSRARLDSSRSENSPRSTPAPSSSASSSRPYLPPPAPSSVSASRPTSTGFQIPYRSRSRKRTREDQESENEGYRSRNSSRHTSPEPTRESERERERGVSRWDRGSFTKPTNGSSTSTGQPTPTTAHALPNGFKRIPNGEVSKSNYPPLRFPLDSKSTPSTSSEPPLPLPLPLPSGPSTLSHPGPSRFRLPPTTSSSLPLPPAPPSAPHPHSHSHSHSHSRKSSSHYSSSYSKGTGSATPRARSPEIPREPMNLPPRGPRQKERERDRDDGYSGGRHREKEEDKAGKVRRRSLSPGEVLPPSSRPRSRSRSRSISSIHHYSKSRRLRSRSRSNTPPPPLPKPEPVEDESEPVSMTPPLPPDRYPLSLAPPQKSTTPPLPNRQTESDTPPRPPPTTTNPILLPSRRRLPPPPPPPPPPAPAVPTAAVTMEMKLEPEDEELEEGEEKEEGEITLPSSASNTNISRPASSQGLHRSVTPELPPKQQEKVLTPPRPVLEEVLQREREEGEIDSEMDHEFSINGNNGNPEKVELVQQGLEEIAEEESRKEKEAELERERLEEMEERKREEERVALEVERQEREREMQLEKELEKETLEMFEPLKDNEVQVGQQEQEESIKETKMDIDQPVVETPATQTVDKSPTLPRISPVLPVPPIEAALPPPVESSAKEEDVAPHPSSTTPLDYHSPPQPISPPTKHIPSGQDEEESISAAAPIVEVEEVLPVVEVERMEEDEVVASTVSLPDREEWFKPTWEDFSMHQGLMIPFLIEEFEERDQRRGEKMVELRQEYKKFDRDWQGHVKRLDKLKERIQRKSGINKHSSTAAQTPSIDSSGMPYYPEPVTPGPSALGGGRGNRRGGGGGLSNSATWGYGDAVRSEAEFLEILASLENADLRDPDVRAARTAAVVPDLAVDPSERAEITSCTFDDERYRVEDPVEAYGVRTPMETWTEAEVETYCKRYSLHPKQFGKISQELPDKTTAQCVLFYYRMKNSIDFRSLSERRGRDGRRKKTKKRPGEGKGKGSSLLSNLKGAKSTMLGNRDRDEEEDDDEDQQQGIPPSPRNTRAPPLPTPDSAPFVPRTTTTVATPRPVHRSLDQLFEDDNDDQTPSTSLSKTARPTTATPRNPASSQLHSEGMMEAAEVLGALAHNPNEEQDDGGSLRPRAAKTNRKVRMDLDDDGAIETVPSASSLSSSLNNNLNGDKLKPKRKANTNSYWSAAEKSDIVRLLELHGKNWKAIGDEMGTKTAVQCKNWFTNNAKKLGLRSLVNGVGMQDDDYQDDESPAMTPNEYSPAVSHQRTSGPPQSSYFPVSEAGNLPPLPSIPTAASIASKAGMHLRNMLNESTPDQEDANSAKEDWFGGGGPNGNMSDDESTSAQSSRPVTAGERFDSRGVRDQQLPHNRIILSNGLARPSSHLPSSSQLPSFPTSLPDRRFDHFLPHHSAPASAVSQWSHSPVASPFASYGSPTPGVSSAPPIADFYRRPTPPDYFNVKTAYPQAHSLSHSQSHSLPQPHAHPLTHQPHRFSAPPVANHTSPPLPSTSTFAPRQSGPPSFPPLPPPPAPLQQSWNPDSHR